jgi:DNA mismatch repair ATPase MutL
MDDAARSSRLQQQQQQQPQTPTIQAIPADSVRRIVAGQVIFDLASAVQELVDNALDAQATTINSTYSCL